MKVLVDTNIMLEVILQRENYNVANQLLTALSEGNHIIYMTVGGFYGMLFTVDKYFKKVKQGTLRCRTNMSRHIAQYLATTLVLTKKGQLQSTNLTNTTI